VYDGKVTTKPEMEFLGSRVRRIGHNNRKWNTWGRVYEGKLRQNRKWNSSGRAFDTVVATTTGSKIFFRHRVQDNNRKWNSSGIEVASRTWLNN